MSTIRRRPEPDRDDGFVLLESIMSISLIVVIVAALGTFFVGTTQAASMLRAKQAATVLADNTVDQIRALSPSDTYAGHASAAVLAQIASAPAKVTPWLAQMYPAYDDSGTAAPLAMTSTQLVGKISFTTTDYIGTCAVPLATASGTDCLQSCPPITHRAVGTCVPGYATSVAVADFIRVVVAVTWSDSHCANSTCAFVTSTLLNSDSDPNFLLNQAPPNSPVVNAISDQTAAINDTITTVQPSLAANTGVAPITWTASNLPAGLLMSSQNGSIAGTVTGLTSTVATGQATVTVIATDAFGRTASKTFAWTVLPDIAATPPPVLTLNRGKALATSPAPSMTATGGSGGPYTWSVPASGAGSLPPGLTMTSAGAFSGTPTQAGTFSSLLTVTDSAQRTRPVTVVWTVVQPAVTGLTALTVEPGFKPGNLATPVSFTYSCPTASCQLSLSGAPSGIGIATTATGAGASQLNVTNASGQIFVVGTVPTTGSAWTLSVTPKDSTNGVTGTAMTAVWTMGPTAVTAAANSTIATQALNYTCAAACTATVSTSTTPSAPAWLAPDAATTTPTNSLSLAAGTGVIYLRGTMPPTVGTYTVTVTFKSGSNTVATSSTSWVGQ